MILIDPEKIEWEPDDRSALKNFLESVPGKRVLEIFAHFKPKFESGSDANKTLVAAGRVEGYEEAVDLFLGLLVERPAGVAKTETDEYPDPDAPAGAPEWAHVDNRT